MNVYVNDRHLGSVGNGETEEFHFEPKQGTRNVLYLHIPPPFDDVKSDHIEFDAKEGSVSKAVSSVDSGFFGSSLKVTITTEKEGLGPAQVLSVKLDRTLKSVVLKETPPVSLPLGTERVVEDTVRVRHEVRIANHWRVEAEVKAKAEAIWASASVRIKGEIERSTNTAYGVETERKRSVTLKGDGANRKVKVVWVEYYRTGTARMLIEAREVEVPFEFKEDFALLTEQVD